MPPVNLVKNNGENVIRAPLVRNKSAPAGY